MSLISNAGHAHIKSFACIVNDNVMKTTKKNSDTQFVFNHEASSCTCPKSTSVVEVLSGHIRDTIAPPLDAMPILDLESQSTRLMKRSNWQTHGYSGRAEATLKWRTLM